ncbi:ABC transporter substrate-binding protein [Oceanidesulfovibrio indonesiensis]|uniref:ABC transporter substrate-binding protein n=1 Tax=Oceanidesulfovibrio indonesiensis TaxID=54767 RepID=A0A7M3MEL5_9BACT|nr:extracellular solute-binding protein [Oceanidesulfovibrio indonesiensis]TVM17336.1 ABC transporter substrate-binding protein [Oceanidesulfovibrio indonesiensis]
MKFVLWRTIATFLLLTFLMAGTAHAERRHALSLHSEPKYGPEFTHFDYVNPNAPKGGLVRFGSIGSYDNFNPFIIKGISADGLGLVYDMLTVKSDDEPFTEYGLIAESMEVAPDNTSVTFHLRPEAKFADGEPVTAGDVEFTFHTLVDKGSPLYKRYYADVKNVVVEDEHTVRFEFISGQNPELPLILGQLPVLPRHFWEGKQFDAVNLDVPLGSGPYELSSFKTGSHVVYTLRDDYWGKDLPVNRGRNNFGTVRYDYYRDDTIAIEALKAGEFDYRQERIAKAWATAYKGPPFDRGHIVMEEIPHSLSGGMQGFVMNTRRDVFRDPRVRYAMNFAFDFEWTNKNLFYDQYARTESYFSNSDLASTGLPSQAELKLLEPFRGKIPEEVFTTEYKAPKTDGSGNVRENLRAALQLLSEAGYTLENGVQTKDGKKLEIELLMRDPAFERIVLPYIRNLERIGVKVTPRMVDDSQYINRLNAYDFDMTTAVLPQSNSPGNEQRYMFSSEAAGTPGARNYMGVQNEAVDALIESIINADSREALITACRAMDRVLLWGHYVVPQWHTGYFRLAYWDLLERPGDNPPYGLDLFSWWIDPEKAEAIRAVRGK